MAVVLSLAFFFRSIDRGNTAAAAAAGKMVMRGCAKMFHYQDLLLLTFQYQITSSFTRYFSTLSMHL